MKKLGILLGATVGMMTAIGTKAVNAKPMTRQEYNDFRGWQLPENEDGEDEGCLVDYQDGEPNTTEYKGYVSWSPKAQFDNAYQDVTKGVSFGYAVELLKAGHRVARAGWNGKGMWLFLIQGSNDIAKLHGYGFGEYIGEPTFLDAIFMRTVDNQLVPWLASQTDVLAEDWQIVE